MLLQYLFVYNFCKGLDTSLRDKALSGGIKYNISRSLINKPPMLCVPLSQIVGSQPRKEKDGTITFKEQWTTEAPCMLSQIYIEPIIRVSLKFPAHRVLSLDAAISVDKQSVLAGTVHFKWPNLKSTPTPILNV